MFTVKYGVVQDKTHLIIIYVNRRQSPESGGIETGIERIHSFTVLY